MKRINTTLITLIVLLFSTITGVQAQKETGLYLGLIGFNQTINPMDISPLNNATKSTFQSFVNGMTPKNGTVLYYSVDNALNKLASMTSAALPNDLVTVAVVTFTDGLDQGSLMLNESYQTNAAYLTAINNRIKNERVGGLNISAYSIGIRGNDVTDFKQFKVNLDKLASPGNAYEVTNMDEVKAKFVEIANSLNTVSQTRLLSLTIPGQENGTRVRFTFDNVTDAAQSTQYLEGVYASRTLTNIVYRGCNSKSGTTVSGTAAGIFVTFSFGNLVSNAGGNVPTNYLKQWAYIPSTNQWQRNSEFVPDNSIGTMIERKSAVIMLVLDCSSSLGNDFIKMQTSANNFLDILSNNSGTTANVGKPANNTPVNSSRPVTQANTPPVTQQQPATASPVGIEMVTVVGGTFTMGATSEQGNDFSADERPTRSVTLSTYAIGKYEVTQKQWYDIMGSWPNTAPTAAGGKGDNYPMYYVSYTNIQSFLAKLNQKTGKKFRLPTEAEWEYAARGGAQSRGCKYSGSNNIDDVAWYNGNCNKAQPVGTKQPNELGIYDMSGNVWEWCADWYGEYSNGAETNPTGPPSGSRRVDRGDSWINPPTDCRVSARSFFAPASNSLYLGFRLALSL
ncbi:hypothetical protein AGMMS49965_04210 [Bacteroidia bacterium]|nr:hypothetical protein AGMMS49965_04210 [Bacteroidia bacterium]